MGPVSASGAPASTHAVEAIKWCRKNGVTIAIATAQLDRFAFSPSQQRFLYSIGIREKDMIFARNHNSQFVNGSLKRPMLLEILKRSNIPAEKTIFFDDQLPNIVVSKEIGITGILIPTPAGLTKKIFDDGIASVSDLELCIFDIDATLTSEIKENFESESKESDKKSSCMMLIVFATIFIVGFLGFLLIKWAVHHRRTKQSLLIT